MEKLFDQNKIDQGISWSKILNYYTSELIAGAGKLSIRFEIKDWSLDGCPIFEVEMTYYNDEALPPFKKNYALGIFPCVEGAQEYCTFVAWSWQKNNNFNSLPFFNEAVR